MTHAAVEAFTGGQELAGLPLIDPGLVPRVLLARGAEPADGVNRAGLGRPEASSNTGARKSQTELSKQQLLRVVALDSPHAEHEGVAVGSVVVLRLVLGVEDGVVAVGQRGGALRVLWHRERKRERALSRGAAQAEQPRRWMSCGGGRCRAS